MGGLMSPRLARESEVIGVLNGNMAKAADVAAWGSPQAPITADDHDLQSKANLLPAALGLPSAPSSGL
jgi:hypothetical protein